jgi:hypothetical protein
VSAEPVDPQDAFGLLRSYSRHRDFVRMALHRIENALLERAMVHDASKMLDDEFAGFSRINAAARINKFGSEEYKAGMKRERATIDLHFSRNSHHPERPTLVAGLHTEPDDYKYQVALHANEMTFLDVIEMVCDWWGARKGYDDPRAWADTVTLNLDAKGKYLNQYERWLALQVASFLAETS